MYISFIHYAIYRLDLGISRLNWYIFMFYRLYFMSEHPACVSGRTIFKITKNIIAPSSWVLKVYADLKALNLRLASVVKEFLIHRPSTFDLRRRWEIIACFCALSSPDTYFAVGWRPKTVTELSAHNISLCESTTTCVINGWGRMISFTSVGVWSVSIAVTIKTSALNPNLDTESSNSW